MPGKVVQFHFVVYPLSKIVIRKQFTTASPRMKLRAVVVYPLSKIVIKRSETRYFCDRLPASGMPDE